MSEQRPGVENSGPDEAFDSDVTVDLDETFDPDVALHLIAGQIKETCDELWSARLQEAAFGEYSALAGEFPADGTEYEEAMLDFVKNFVGDQLSQFREQGLIPLIFDAETGGWYQINGVGLNTELLSLVAVVHDPTDPNSTVTKLLGPGTDLAYTEMTTMFAPTPDPQFMPDTRLHLPSTILQPIPPLLSSTQTGAAD